jgi:hypothetical protein
MAPVASDFGFDAGQWTGGLAAHDSIIISLLSFWARRVYHAD